MTRHRREEHEDAFLLPGATRAAGSGQRARAEEPDPWRTCFERDRDRILHSTAFRRLAGKTQVFVFPEDHQRTRLTHALEVAQVATSVARACRLNVALTEAIALGHDCGHGPGGHASEDALDPYLDEGFDHAPWGADVSLASLNLCAETLDGIRNHSWSRPAPSTPEGEVVSWADRIAYVCHDWEDAVATGIVTPALLPESVRAPLRGTPWSASSAPSSTPWWRRCSTPAASAWTRTWPRPWPPSGPATTSTSTSARPPSPRGRRWSPSCGPWSSTTPTGPTPSPTFGRPGGSRPATPSAVRAAVTYVAGMTDRFAFRQAVAVLGWDPAKLPTGVGS